jgi:hypothetical protein
MAMINTLPNAFRKLALFVAPAAVLIGSFAAHGKMPVDTSAVARGDYPPSIEESAARREAVQEAWKKLLTESGLPFTQLELVPALNTPNSLPITLSGRISVSAKGGELSEAEMKEALRSFIERNIGILIGNPENSSLAPGELSLINFLSIGRGQAYRAIYRQTNYPLQIAGEYGELHLWVDKKGRLINWQSLLIPKFDLPASPAVDESVIIDSVLGAEFKYSTMRGKPVVYRVTSREEIVIKETVIYPKLEGQRLLIHLAITASVRRGDWDVYIDAINGRRIGERQNFNT